MFGKRSLNGIEYERREKIFNHNIKLHNSQLKLHEVAKDTILDRCKQNTYGPGLKEKGVLVSTSQSVGTLRSTWLYTRRTGVSSDTGLPLSFFSVHPNSSYLQARTKDENKPYILSSRRKQNTI